MRSARVLEALGGPPWIEDAGRSRCTNSDLVKPELSRQPSGAFSHVDVLSAAGGSMIDVTAVRELYRYNPG